MAKIVRGEFSKISGSKVRIVYDAQGHILGTITKKDDNSGYRIHRVKDGKMKEKKLLEDAFKAVSRAN